MFKQYQLFGLALAALLVLAGCNSTDATLGVTSAETNGQAASSLQPTSPAEAAKASARLYVAPIIGSTVAAVTPLSRRLAALAPANSLAIVAEADPTKTFVVKGYFSALPENGSTIIVFVWDVFDPAGVRQHRIQGQENVAAVAADRWSIVPPATMERIADRTIADFKTWQSGVAAPAAVVAPLAAPVIPNAVTPNAVAPTAVVPSAVAPIAVVPSAVAPAVTTPAAPSPIPTVPAPPPSIKN